MMNPHKRHGLLKEFSRRFSESLFVLDEEDVKKVKLALEANGESWDKKMKYDRQWFWKRAKHNVLSPQHLVPILKSLFLSFGPLKCSKSGRALFDKLVWNQALSVLKTVQLGQASDPPNVELYYKIGKKDKYGLTLYRCIRGTNSLEGGVHQNLIRKFGSFGAGPELADAMLTEYRLRHNLDVGSVNRLGCKFSSHYNPWLVQHIDALYQQLSVHKHPKSDYLVVEINAMKFRGSNEVFGICPLPEEEMQSLGIETAEKEPDNVNDNHDRTIPTLQDTVSLKTGSTLRAIGGRYTFVAKRQLCKFAVIATCISIQSRSYNSLSDF